VRDAVIGVLALVRGLLRVIFPRAVVREGVVQNNRFFKLGPVRVDFGENEAEVGAWVIIAAGVFFVIPGILRILGDR